MYVLLFQLGPKPKSSTVHVMVAATTSTAIWYVVKKMLLLAPATGSHRLCGYHVFGFNTFKTCN